jgi:hypothetical protein
MNATGLRKVELQGRGFNYMKEKIQPAHANFLQKAGETLGISFPLDKDPARWAD